MHLASVKVSTELIERFLTEGELHQSFMVEAGLPPGAKLLKIEPCLYSPEAHRHVAYSLVFEHPSFPEVRPFRVPTTLDVRFQSLFDSSEGGIAGAASGGGSSPEVAACG